MANEQFTQLTNIPANNTMAVPVGLPMNTPANSLYPMLHELLAIVCNVGLQSGAFTFTDTGSLNALAISTGIPGNVTLAAGQEYRIQVLNTTTVTAPTLAVDTNAAKPVVYSDGSALVAGELVAGSIRRFTFDGTSFRLQTVIPATGVSGQVSAFGTSSAPQGWLVCDGSAVSRATYAALYGAIGTTWGAGDGSTTFNLPDARGRTVIGAGTGSGLTARTIGTTLGEENHQLALAELPAHTHAYDHGAPVAVAGGSSTYAETYDNSNSATTTSTGSNTAHNNMQPSIVMLVCIKT